MKNLLLLFIGTFFFAYNSFSQAEAKANNADTTVRILQSVTVSANATNPLRTISQADIALRRIDNSQEVLRIVPGLFIGQHAGGGKAEQLFLRGFDIDHGTDVNISLDGMPVNMVSHAHGQGYADLHFVIPELIENVQFKKGPYSAEKGNMATAGHVDFQTRQTLRQSMVKLEAGMFDTYRGVAAVNLLDEKLQQKGQSAYVASEYMFTNGYFDSPQNFHRLNLFGKYYSKLSNRSTLDLSASTFRSKWNASGQIPERAVNEGLISFFGAIDANEGGETGRTNVNAQLLTQLNNNNRIKNQLYYTAYDFELYSNFTFFNIDSINGDQIKQKENRNLIGYNGSYTNERHIGKIKLTSEAGASLRYDRTTGSELSRTKNRTQLIEPLKLGDINELNTSLYVDEIIRLNNEFSINAGLRWDGFYVGYLDKLDNNTKRTAQKGIFSPKLNFYYNPNDRVNVYLNTGKGFHSNDTRVVVQTGGREILPAAYGADLGIILKPTRHLLLNVAAWYLYLEQEFVYVGDEGVVEPSGKTRRQGVDFSIRYEPFRKLFFDADANYCYARAIDEPKGANYIPLAPVFTSTGGITYKSNVGLNGSLRYRYMYDRPANEDKSIVAKGYFINDLVLNYTRPRYELSVTVQNIFNVRWKETQFDTESRLKDEPQPVSEIHFTPGTPLFIKMGVSFNF